MSCWGEHVWGQFVWGQFVWGEGAVIVPLKGDVNLTDAPVTELDISDASATLLTVEDFTQ